MWVIPILQSTTVVRLAPFFCLTGYVQFVRLISIKLYIQYINTYVHTYVCTNVYKDIYTNKCYDYFVDSTGKGDSPSD